MDIVNASLTRARLPLCWHRKITAASHAPQTRRKAVCFSVPSVRFVDAESGYRKWVTHEKQHRQQPVTCNTALTAEVVEGEAVQLHEQRKHGGCFRASSHGLSTRYAAPHTHSAQHPAARIPVPLSPSIYLLDVSRSPQHPSIIALAQ